MDVVPLVPRPSSGAGAGAGAEHFEDDGAAVAAAAREVNASAEHAQLLQLCKNDDTVEEFVRHVNSLRDARPARGTLPSASEGGDGDDDGPRSCLQQAVSCRNWSAAHAALVAIVPAWLEALLRPSSDAPWEHIVIEVVLAPNPAMAALIMACAPPTVSVDAVIHTLVVSDPDLSVSVWKQLLELARLAPAAMRLNLLPFDNPMFRAATAGAMVQELRTVCGTLG